MHVQALAVLRELHQLLGALPVHVTLIRLEALLLERIQREQGFANLIGNSPGMRRVFEMVQKVAEGVRRAMAEAGIEDPADVHYVQTKTPLLVMETINDAKARGHTVFTEDPLESMNVSNGTSALGIAVALGEIDMPTAEQIGHDLGLYSSVASCSSGVELDQAQTVVVGNVPGAGGRYRIGHDVMKDALDQEGVYRAIRSAGLPLPERARAEDLEGRLVNVFVKCEADPTSRLRGRRHPGRRTRVRSTGDAVRGPG